MLAVYQCTVTAAQCLVIRHVSFFRPGEMSCELWVTQVGKCKFLTRYARPCNVPSIFELCIIETCPCRLAAAVPNTCISGRSAGLHECSSCTPVVACLPVARLLVTACLSRCYTLHACYVAACWMLLPCRPQTQTTRLWRQVLKRAAAQRLVATSVSAA